MPEKLWAASSARINCNPDAIIVVGGSTRLEVNPALFSRSASLLLHTREGSRKSWSWRTLSPMSEGRGSPGVLQLDRLEGDLCTQRVLVAGRGRNSAEILRIDCSDSSDRGQWTQIGLLSRTLPTTFLAALHGRVLAFGKLICDGAT